LTDRTERIEKYKKDRGMHYFNFVMNDFFADSSYLTPLQSYTYFRLICECYRSGESINSNELEYFSRKFKTSLEDVQLVLNDFFELDEEGNYYQQRIKKTIDAYHSKQSSSSKGGKATAAKKSAEDYAVVRSSRGIRRYLKGFVEAFDGAPEYSNKGYQHAGYKVWKDNDLEEMKTEVNVWLKKYFESVSDMKYAKSFVTLLKDGLDVGFKVESNADKYARETSFIK
jgi:uncharacterized protein YdaU (DUF1376 family)